MLCFRCVSANIILETVEDLLPQHLGADHEHAISIWVYLKFPGDRRLRKNLHMAVFLSVDLVAFHFITEESIWGKSKGTLLRFFISGFSISRTHRSNRFIKSYRKPIRG